MSDNFEETYNKIEFGKRISDLRKKRWKQYAEFKNKAHNPYSQYKCCKSQDSFASELELERRTIGKWELGTSVPSFEEVLKICKLLECNIDYLLGKDDLTGFSTLVLASHYSRINKDIIEFAQKDDEYLDFLNYFMKPSNCYDLINSLSLSEWKSFLSKNTLDELNGSLKVAIDNIFQQYLAFTPIDNYNKDSFKEYVISKLPEDKISFKARKLDDKIYIPSCISNTLYVELGFSDNDSENYNILMNFISDNCFEILLNNTMLEIQKDKIGKSFLQLITSYFAE